MAAVNTFVGFGFATLSTKNVAELKGFNNAATARARVLREKVARTRVVEGEVQAFEGTKFYGIQLFDCGTAMSKEAGARWLWDNKRDELNEHNLCALRELLGMKGDAADDAQLKLDL